MKLNKISILSLGFAAFLLSACSEGKYWEGPDSYGEAYAFPKTDENVQIPADSEVPDYYDVTVNRTEAGPAISVPVTFTGDKELVLTAGDVDAEGNAYVTFADGELAAPFRIMINKENMIQGRDYSCTLGLADEDGILHVKAENLKMKFTIRHILVLTWEDAGTVTAYSSFFGMSASEAAEVPIQKATNYPDTKYDMYRLVSPYYYMVPEYAEEGYNVPFRVNKGSAYRAAKFSDDEDTDVAMGVVDELDDGTPIDLFLLSDGAKFSNSKTQYTIKATIGFRDVDADPGTEITKSGTTESLKFTWTH